MIDQALMDTSTGQHVLKDDAIKRVFLEPIASSTMYLYDTYEERPSPYKVKLRGEKRKRRIYTTPIGNVSVVYLKSEGVNVFCETALDSALNRTEDEDHD